MTVEAVILAGGLGQRLGLPTPKPLLDLCGKPLLRHVTDAAEKVADRLHIVHSPEITDALQGFETSGKTPVQLHLQKNPRGTADALKCALPEIRDDSVVLVLCADTPLLQTQTLEQLLQERHPQGLALMTLHSPESTLGRIIRDKDQAVVAIREHADANEAERALEECNAGVLAASARDFRTWLSQIDTQNAQNEFYLTDCIALAIAAGTQVATCECDPTEGLGINTLEEYLDAGHLWQQRARMALMTAGVVLEAPDTLWLSANLNLDAAGGARIGPHVVLEGTVRLEAGVHLLASCVVRNCTIGTDTRVESFSVLEDACIGARCRVGPFARIRPQTDLADEVQIGNFVEIKKSHVGAQSKINHLSYVGDSEIGQRVNLGAGTITCNYDGAHKHQTVIGDDVFIGSGSQLIAPVTIGKGATIGAGSTITKDAPVGELTLERGQQTTHPGWRRPIKD